jgi:hypothetical protein
MFAFSGKLTPNVVGGLPLQQARCKTLGDIDRLASI